MAMGRSALEKLESDLSEVLMISVKNGYEDVAAKAIHELAEHNAGPGCFDFSDDEKYFSPLMYTCERGLMDTAKLLLEQGANPGFIGNKKRSSSKLNAFHLASMKGHAEIVHELLNAPIIPSGSQPAAAKTCRYGLTPAMYAVENGHLEILQLLMEVDENLLTTATSKGQTVLHIAARGSKEEHLQCLNKLCSRLDSTNREDLITTLDKNGWNVLHHACAGGRVDCLEWLLEEFKPELARPSVVNQTAKSSGYTPFLVACEYKKVEIVEFLLQVEGVDCKACAVKSDSEGGKTGLHIAAIHDSVKLAQILIREGCPPAALDEQGNTALHIATRNSSFDVIDVLIAADSGLEKVPNKEGKLAADIEPQFVIPPEIKKRGREREYVQALRKGRGKIPRCNLLILGEQRVGKTSLYNLLIGQKFEEDRDPTLGIDNTTVVTMVDTRHLSIESWKEVDEGEKKEMDEEAFQNEIARLITPLDAREDKVTTPTEEDLLQRIVRAVDAYEKTVSFSPTFHISKYTSLPKPKRVRFDVSSPVIPSQHKDIPIPAVGHPKARIPQSASPAAPSTTTEATPVRPRPQRVPAAAIHPRSVAKIRSKPSERDTGLIVRISRRHAIGIHKIRKSGSVVKSDPDLHLNTFDFAGQKVYRPMHHCFITGRAMYIVVFNLRKFIDEVREASRESLEELRYWLHSIHAHIRKDADKESGVRQVVLVGTHRSPKGVEISEDELHKIDEILEEELLHEDCNNRCVNRLSFLSCPSQPNQMFAAVENSHDKPSQRQSSGATILQDKLKKLAKDLPFLKEDHPLVYLRFEEVLVQYKQKLNIHGSSQIVALDKVLDLAKQSGLGGETDEEEGGGEEEEEEEEDKLTSSRSMQTALDFFHDTGTIVVLSKLPKMFLNKLEKSELKGLVLLDPKWLLKVMRTVIELDIHAEEFHGQEVRDLAKKGVATVKLLRKCWEPFLKGGSERSFWQLCRIMQAYALIFPINAADTSASTPPSRSASVPVAMSQTTPATRSQSDRVDYNFSERFLVPCRLPEKSKVKSLTGLTFFIDFQGFLPVEIFHRLICLMLNKSRSVPDNGKLMLNSTCCYFTRVENCQWRMEVLDKDCLKVTVRPHDDKTLLEVESEHILTYLSMFYLEFLSRVCMKSGLQGIVYNAGPRCTAKQEGKICGEVLPMIRHDLGDEDLPVVCDYCPASYSQEELSNLMKDWDLELAETASTTPSSSQSTPITFGTANTVVVTTGPTNIYEKQVSISGVGRDSLPLALSGIALATPEDLSAAQITESAHIESNLSSEAVPLSSTAQADCSITGITESAPLIPPSTSYSGAGQDSLTLPNIALTAPADLSAIQITESPQITENDPLSPPSVSSSGEINDSVPAPSPSTASSASADSSTSSAEITESIQITRSATRESQIQGTQVEQDASPSTASHGQPALRLGTLKRFPGKNGKIHIIEKVTADITRDLGTFLLDDEDGTRMSIVKAKVGGDLRDVAEEVFSQWLQGKGGPVTWEHLIESLNDANFSCLANEIEFVVKP